MVEELVYERVDQDGEILPPNAPEPEPDPMKDWIDRCNQAGDSMDALRWIIGECAVKVTKKYGEDRLGYFAAQIHQSKSVVYEYEAMFEFYADERRRYSFLEESPTVRYTHFRIAKQKAKQAGASVDQAYLYLDRAAIRGWTPDEFGKIMTRAFRIFGGGAKKPKPVVKDAPVSILSFDEMNDTVCFKVHDDKALKKLIKAFNEGRTDDLLLTLK